MNRLASYIITPLLAVLAVSLVGLGWLAPVSALAPCLTIAAALLLTAAIGLFRARMTERRHLVAIEQRLMDNESQRRADIETLPCGVLHIDEDGRLLFANPAALAIFGERAQFARMVEDLIAPEDRQRFQSHYAAFPPARFEIRGQKSDAVVWCEIEAGRTIWDGRTVDRLAIRDITVQKTAEAALEQARELAEAAKRAKSEFLVTLSQEIRVPVTAIVALGDQGLKTPLTPQQRDLLEEIQASAGAALGIIDDSLDVSKMEAGMLAIEHRAFELDDLLDGIVALHGEVAARKGIELVFAIPPGLPRVLIGDMQRIGQVLSNLVANAVKFTEFGDVIVAADAMSRRDGEVEIRFAVRDNGVGLTATQRDALFHASRSTDGEMRRRTDGAGRGLAISKRLVELMGGVLTVESEPNAGSEFSFTIRLGVRRDRRAGSGAERTAFRGLRLLVVDDSVGSCAMLRSTFTACGMEVVTVASGADALRRLGDDTVASPYDLILVDWKLPDYDGLDLAHRLRTLDHPRLTPIRLMVAGPAQARLEEPARAAGFGALLVKPLNAPRLLNALGDVITRPADLLRATDDPHRLAPAAHLAGAEILLVEDNEINQMVARGILENAKVKLTIAENGREAIEALRAARFDLVLMDLQMPVMDGYAATRVIREELGLRDLPIIAVTAHALAEERRNCFVAGMNEHISKPIDPQRLLSVLARFIQVEARCEVPAPIAAPVAVENSSLPGIDLDDAMRRLGGNRDLLDRVYAEFCEHYANAAAEVAALAPDRAEEARRLVHTIKGVAGNIGAKRVFKTALALETALHVPGDIAEPLANFAAALAECVPVSRPEPVAAPASDEPCLAVDDAVVRPLVARLDLLLRRRDLDAEDCFADLKASCAKTRFDGALKALESKISALDFEAASQSLAAFDQLFKAEPVLEAR